MGKKKRLEQNYFDYGLLVITMIIIAFGLMMIFSTSSYTAQMDYGDSAYYFKQQMKHSILGFAVMFIVYKIDYRYTQKFATWIFVFSLLTVVALIPFGKRVNGAKRWIRISFISFQPADVVKLGVIIMLAAILCRLGRHTARISQIIKWFLIVSIPACGLVMGISSNLSSAIIIFGIAFVITFVAYPGYKLYVFLAGAGTAAIIGGLEIFKSMIENENFPSGFRLARVMIWLDPESYIDGKGYQTVQALYAIGSGGLFGKGLGKSLQKLGFIPESQNDMIYSIICEELGLFGAVCVMILYMLMLWRIARVAMNAADLYGMYLSVGVFAHIAIQVILNIAVASNFIPNTGVSLPFISYGGTSTVILMAELGLVLNVSSKIKMER